MLTYFLFSRKTSRLTHGKRKVVATRHEFLKASGVPIGIKPLGKLGLDKGVRVFVTLAM